MAPSSHVARRRIRRAVDEVVEIDQRPQERDDRERHKQPVERRDTRARALAVRSRVEHEAEDEHDQQEARAIDERLNDAENPVERVQREADREHRRDARRPSGQLPRGRFEFVVWCSREWNVWRDYCFHTPRS